MYKKLLWPFVDNFFYNVNICILLTIFKVCIFKKYLYLQYLLYLHLILWIPSEKLLTRFDNVLAINLALSINCNMYNMFFVISSPFLSFLVTSFSVGTIKIIYYFSMFSTKQVNCLLNSSANLFMMKWES